MTSAAPKSATSVLMLFALSLSLLAGSATGATKDFTGKNSTLWSDPVNWSTLAVPTSTPPGDDLTFIISPLNKAENDFTLAPYPVNKMTISSGATGWLIRPFGTLNGEIALNTDIDASGIGATSEVKLPIKLVTAVGGSHTITGGTSALLRMTGPINTNGLQMTLANKVAIEGTLSGSGPISIAGTTSTVVDFKGGSSSYGGTATVNGGGTLLVDGDYSLGSLTVNVSTGANLDVRGGNVAIANVNGNLYVGDSTIGSTESGTARFTDLALAGSTSSLTIDINGTAIGSGYDQVYAMDAVTISGASPSTLTVRIGAGFTPPGGTVFHIIQIDNGSFTGMSGQFSNAPEGSTITVGGVQFNVHYYTYGLDLTVPSTSRTWNGGVAPTPRAWSLSKNWREGSVPPPGADLVFPTNASDVTPLNDLRPGSVVNTIQIDSPSYVLSGSAISLNNGITSSGADPGTATISMPITVGTAQTFAGGIPLFFNGALAVNDLLKLTGTVSIDAPMSGSGGVIVEGPGSVASINTTSTMAGAIQSQVGAFVRFTGSHAGMLSAQSDSTIAIDGSANEINVSGILIVSDAGTVGGASASTITLGPTAEVRYDFVGDGTNQYDRMAASSTITLGGAHLTLNFGGFLPVPGTQFTIVQNDGRFSAIGTFASLPEGATVTAGGLSFQISYKGGDGNDVVLTALGSTTCAVAISVSPSVRAGSTGNTASVVPAPSGSTFNWQIANGTITAGQGTAQIVWTAGPAGVVQLSVQVSGNCSANASQIVTIDQTPASVILSAPAAPIILQKGTGVGGSTSFALTNIGDVATSVTFTQIGSFFTQAPASFQLGPGASQTVTVSVPPQSQDGASIGASLPQGVGVPAGLKVPVTLLVTSPPATGTPNVIATIDRIDLSAARGQNPRGSASFKNIGDGIANGTPSSDVPWITPDPTGVVSIAPGATISVGFSIDRQLRPDFTSPTGSVLGTLSFVYTRRTAGLSGRQTMDSSTSFAASVPVSDTVKPPTSASTIPPLQQNEVALVIPGVGNVVGSGGKLFVSDLTLLNKSPLASVADAKMYYIAPDGKTTQATLDAVSPAGSVSLANVVSTVFSQTQQVGTLMIRSSQVNNLVANATIFNDNNPKGRYGTAIPVLRSDAAVTPGQRLVIGGVARQDGKIHTNLYVQEMSGVVTNATIRFLDANAQQVGSPLPLTIQPFSLAQAGNSVPVGAVSAVVTNDSGGRILGYATPVDDSPGGGDTWAQADWNRQFNLNGTQPLLIPVAGAVPGANNTYFRTDVSITNNAGIAASARLRYTAGALVVEKTIALQPLATAVLNDIVASYLGVTPPSIGFLTITPLGGGAFAVTSRTYTAVQGSDATFGTATPTVSLNSGLVVGQGRLIGGLEDSKQTTVNAGTPKTARTNFGLVETKGQPVTVKVSLFLMDGRSLAFGQAKGSLLIDLKANELQLIPSMAKTILGAARETQFGDLKNVMIKFEVVSGSGGLVPFVTSTDNGTGDTILKME